MISLKKIAEEAGVSYTLVSKVLSGNLGTTGVSEKTRKSILRKARELDYTPNRLAVALKAGRKGSVGIFLHTAGTPGSDVAQRLLTGLAEGIESSGFRMWLRFFTKDEEFLAACDDKVKREVDGLIVAGCDHPKLVAHLRKMDREGLPVVTVFADLPKRATSSITNAGVDYHLQGFLGASHLFDQGCLHLAHFRTTESRYEGFVRAHQERNILVNPELVLDMGTFGLDSDRFSVDAGRLAVKRLFELKSPFDGIVCQSDAQAVGAINEMVRRGIEVPGSVKVTGVDDSPLAESCIVPVTSLTSGMARSGIEAAQLLLKKIEHQPVNSVTVHSELMIRESSARI